MSYGQRGKRSGTAWPLFAADGCPCARGTPTRPSRHVCTERGSVEVFCAKKGYPLPSGPKVPADLPDRNAVFLRGNGGVHLGFGHFRRPPYWSSRGAPRKDRFPRGTEGSKGEPWLSGPTLYPRSPPRFRSMAAAENVRTLTGPGGHCERRRFHVHIKRRRFHVHIKGG